MEEFKFKYKKYILWRTETVVGFSFTKESDRMSLYYKDGSCKEISSWSNYDCYLGTDYFDIRKRRMEAKVGQTIPTNIVRP